MRDRIKNKIKAMWKRLRWRNKLDSLSKEQLVEYIYTVTKDVSYKHWKTNVSADNTDVKGIIRCAMNYSTDPVFVEIGSFMGRTTCALGMVARLKGGRSTVVAIDDFMGDPKHKTQFKWVKRTFRKGFYHIFCRNVRKFKLEEIVKPIRKFSNEAIDDLKGILSDRKCDLIFIDGDHSYEGVSSDIENYTPFLNTGGTIIFDDYANEEVKRAIDDYIDMERFERYTTNEGNVVYFKLVSITDDRNPG